MLLRVLTIAQMNFLTQSKLPFTCIGYGYKFSRVRNRNVKKTLHLASKPLHGKKKVCNG